MSPTLLFVTSQYAQDARCASLLLKLADGEQFEDEVLSEGVVEQIQLVFDKQSELERSNLVEIGRQLI